MIRFGLKLAFIALQAVCAVWLTCLSWQDYSDATVKLIVIAICVLLMAIAFQLHFWDEGDKSIKN